MITLLIKKEKEADTNVKSCATCRWAGCRNYGWENRPTCINYISVKN